MTYGTEAVLMPGWAINIGIRVKTGGAGLMFLAAKMRRALG